jgi:hypothetical protein
VIAVLTVEVVPTRYEGPEVHVGKAVTVPTVEPVRVNVSDVEIPVRVPLRCRLKASVQIGVPEGVQLAVLYCVATTPTFREVTEVPLMVPWAFPKGDWLSTER